MLALAVGLAAVLWCWLDQRLIRPIYPLRDFDCAWIAGRLLLHGQNPYSLIGPGLKYQCPYTWGWNFYYPATAAVAVLPLAWLPVFLARLAFVGLSFGALAFVVDRTGWYRWPMFVSACALESASSGQWTPLLIAAALTPWAGGLLAAKPNLAFPLLLARPDKRQWIGTALGAVVLLAVAFWLMPGWVPAWLRTLGSYGDPPLIVMWPLGPLVALALLRWREPDARLLLLMACTVHSVTAYAELPLFLIPKTTRQAFVLCVGSYLASNVQGWAIDARGMYNLRLADSGYLLFLYLPALVMVFQRENRPDVSFALLRPIRPL